MHNASSSFLILMYQKFYRTLRWSLLPRAPGLCFGRNMTLISYFWGHRLTSYREVGAQSSYDSVDKNWLANLTVLLFCLWLRCINYGLVPAIYYVSNEGGGFIQTQHTKGLHKLCEFLSQNGEGPKCQELCKRGEWRPSSWSWGISYGVHQLYMTAALRRKLPNDKPKLLETIWKCR